MCPCGSKRSESWHYKYKIPVCEPIRQREITRKRNERSNAPKVWSDDRWANGQPVGSLILVPELDPL